MRNALSLVLVSLAAAAHAAPVPSTDVPTTIDAVTVFPSQALVLRRARVTLPPGPCRLRIPGLPAKVLDDSVRVLVGGATLVGSSVESVPAEDQVVPEARDAENELRALEDQSQSLDAAVRGLGEQRAFLVSMRSAYDPKGMKGLVPKGDPKSWEAADAFLAKGLSGIVGEGRKLDLQRRDLNRKIELVRKKLEQLRSKRGTLTKAVLVDIRSSGGGNATLSLRYLVPDVSWRSVYDARLRGTRVTLTHYAFVTQESGEDWENVKMSLSTAETTAGIAVPRLFSRNLSAVVQEIVTVAKEMARSPRGGAAATAPPPPPPPPETTEAEARQAEFVTTYDAATRVSVPSSPAGRKTNIAALRFDAKLEHVSVPKRAQGAYMTAVGRLSRQLPLPSGEVSLFFGNEYVGTTNIEQVVPGGEVRLPFGRDERIKVERQLVERKRHEQGVFSKEARYDYRYRILVANNSTGAIELLVLDQYPVASTDQIKVELFENTTPRTPVPNETPGSLRWKLQVAPGKRAELLLGFAVAYPLGKRIVGLD